MTFEEDVNLEIRLIATDLDGTLLNREQKISPENARALRECAARGIHIALASGRSFESARLFAREMGLNCAILSCNGARVDLSPFGPLFSERVFEIETSRRIYEAMLLSGIYFACYAPSTVYMNNHQQLLYHSHEPKVDMTDGYRQEYVDSPERMEREGIGRAYKYVAFCDEPERIERLRRSLTGLPCEIVSSWHDNIEVLPPGAGKGAALSELAAHLGIERAQVAAFGDQLNDLEMLRFAGFPVAMGNAIDELKAAAAHIAPHHDPSGVAQVIDRFILNREARR